MYKLIVLMIRLLSVLNCHVQAQACGSRPLDLGLILDSSWSIGERNWIRPINFAKILVEQFNVSRDGTHVAAMVYGNRPQMVLRFSDSESASKNDVARILDGLPYKEGRTFIEQALIMARLVMFSTDNGMRTEATKVAVVTTDGKQTEKDSLTPVGNAAAFLKKTGVIVFAVGIGRAVQSMQLLEIASTEEYVIHGSTFFDMVDIVWKIVGKICPFGKVQVDFQKKPRGSVFVTNNNTRLPLCGDFWGNTTARVACKTRGFSDGSYGTFATTTGSGYDRFWNVEFYCTGREPHISECSIKTINISDTCKENRIAAVSCKDPLHFIQVPPSPLLLLQGKNASLTCSADGLPTPRITWELNGKPIIKDNKEASIDIVNIRHNANYTCIATSGTGKKEKVIEIVVLVFPVITNTFDDARPTVGSSFKQTCEVTGYPLPSIIWSKDGSSKVPFNYLDPDNNRTLWMKKVKVQDSGNYNCIATNSVGKTSESLRLTVIGQNVKQTTSNTDTILYAVGTSLGVVVLFVILVLGVHYIRKRLIKREVTTLDEIERCEDPWEFPLAQLFIRETVGRGAFGEVRKAIAKGLLNNNEEVIVAVKQAKKGDRSGNDTIEQEIKQGKVLGTDRHPNICNLLGCITLSEPITAIYEFAEHGDLLEFLRKCRGEHGEKSEHDQAFVKCTFDPEKKCEGTQEPVKVLTSYDLVNFCIQIAAGMEFLHSKGIIHRDLAARNVLVTDDFSCKITDFGLAIERGNYGYASEAKKGQLPIKWSAPELLFDTDYAVSAKIDVWSYGVLMYEILTIGGTPYPRWPPYQVLFELQLNNYRMAKPPHVSDFMYNVMSLCWENDPGKRPSFDRIHSMLVDQQSTEYLDMDNVNMDKYEPYLYPNVDGQCDLDSNLPKEEMVDKFETQITAAHVQGDEKAHLSQQQDTSDARTSHVESKSAARRFEGLVLSEAFEQEVVPEDVEIQQLLPSSYARKAAQNCTETCV